MFGVSIIIWISCVTFLLWGIITIYGGLTKRDFSSIKNRSVIEQIFHSILVTSSNTLIFKYVQGWKKKEFHEYCALTRKKILEYSWHLIFFSSKWGKDFEWFLIPYDFKIFFSFSFLIVIMTGFVIIFSYPPPDSLGKMQINIVDTFLFICFI